MLYTYSTLTYKLDTEQIIIFFFVHSAADAAIAEWIVFYPREQNHTSRHEGCEHPHHERWHPQTGRFRPCSSVQSTEKRSTEQVCVGLSVSVEGRRGTGGTWNSFCGQFRFFFQVHKSRRYVVVQTAGAASRREELHHRRRYVGSWLYYG